MTFTNYKVAATAAAVAASLTAQTHVAGFMLTEHSSGALGRAYAGDNGSTENGRLKSKTLPRGLSRTKSMAERGSALP